MDSRRVILYTCTVMCRGSLYVLDTEVYTTDIYAQEVMNCEYDMSVA